MDTSLATIEEQRVSLAAYFCEDVKTFRFDECCTTIFLFCTKLQYAARVRLSIAGSELGM